jgi:sialate O-acetylesterase
METRIASIAVFMASLLAASAARADVKPAVLFGDHMVLQQSMSVPVWGTADPGEQVTVAFGGQTQAATAGPDGKWMVHLADLKAGGPLEMTIAGKNTITIKDVLIGEVWLGSGQSNMTFPVSKSRGAYAGLLNEKEEIAAADYPQIRMFTGRPTTTYQPQTTVRGEWEVCSPATVPGFSAVGYLFSRDLQKEIKVPVGFITVAYGAATAESFISRDALMADPLLKWMVDGLDARVQLFKTDPSAPASQAPKRPWPINKTPGRPAKQSDPTRDQHEPTLCFNGMINPVIPCAIRGIVWYQGESISGGDAGLSLYPHIQTALIQDWRARWGEGDLPFYVVQLPGQKNISNNPRVREGQASVLKLPNTGMAVTIDIGEANNVHPHNKAPLGDRLARIALANVYGRAIEYSGPLYDSFAVEGGSIRVKFTHLGGGLVARGGDLKWFQIAGSDRKFVGADAKIDGDSIVVSSPRVSAPAAVRYAWDDYPDGCNLYNAAGLPASPFRTDNWAYPIPGIVE